MLLDFMCFLIVHLQLLMKVQSYITCDENVESVEEVEAVEIFSISNIGDNFVSLHNIQISAVELVDPQLVSQFFETISITLTALCAYWHEKK